MTGKDYFSDKNVLITGATGLVGPYVVNALLDAGVQNAVCIVRDRVPDSIFFTEGAAKKCVLVSGELQDYFLLERVINEYEISNIIHLGAQAIVGTANRSPLATFESNIKGTWNVLEAARVHDKLVKSVVVASSDKAYGDQEKLPYTEESPLLATHPYDASKSCADILSTAYGKTYGLPVSISRCGNFFGGGDLNFNRIVPGTIRNAHFNKPPEIRGDGKAVRDYIYVKDAASAYLLLSEKTENAGLKGEAFNFSNEVQMNVLEMMNKILVLMGKTSLKPIIMNNASGEIFKQHLSAEKARRILGWKSEWTVDSGLKETIEWYKKYFKGG
ncbi:MAG: GDP-mannose 4,6-dehydratase [Candidatus Micrarchaeota archaeon]